MFHIVLGFTNAWTIFLVKRSFFACFISYIDNKKKLLNFDFAISLLFVERITLLLVLFLDKYGVIVFKRKFRFCSTKYIFLENQPRHEKTCLRGLRPD